MSKPKIADLGALLDALIEGGVEFIVVGGASAILHGALAMTQDLDVVHARTRPNVDRIVGVLDALDAYVRDPGGRRLRPSVDHLMAGGQLNLITNLGPLDLLGRLHDGRGYEDLVDHSEWMTDGARRVRILDLPTLIQIKTSAGRPKDRLVVPLLLALLRTRGRG